MHKKLVLGPTMNGQTKNISPCRVKGHEVLGFLTEFIFDNQANFADVGNTKE